MRISKKKNMAVFMVLCILVAMLAAGCGQEAVEQNESPATERFAANTEAPAAAQTAPTEEAAAEPVAEEKVQEAGKAELAEAYASAAERALENYPYYNDSAYGILYDIDADEVDELILSHMAMMDTPDGYYAPCFVYSIYDYENEKLVTLAENEYLSIEAGGDAGYAGVVIRDDIPVLITYAAEGETGYGGAMFYTHTLYDFSSFETIGTFSIEEIMGESKSYYVDGEACTESEFILAANEVTYLEYRDGRLTYHFETIPLKELSAYLESYY